MSSIERHLRGRRGSFSLAALIGLINIAIVWPLFSTEYLIHLQSNEASYAVISRFLRSGGEQSGWFPYWDLGMPTENTYLPLVPHLTSWLASICNISDINSYHKICGCFYVLGGIGVLFLVRQMSFSTMEGFIAASVWSLFSPSAVLFSEIATDVGGFVFGKRLHSLVYYGDGPHIISVALLIWSLFFYWKARQGQTSYCSFVLLGLASFTANAFGAVSLALSIVATELSLSTRNALFGSIVRGLATILGIAILALPWCTPILYSTIVRQSQYVGGDYGWTKAKLFAWILIGVLYLAGARYLTSLRVVVKFGLLLALSVGVIPTAHYYLAIDLAPQPERYHLELELICAILVGVGVASAARRARTLVALGIVVFLAGQFVNYYQQSRRLIREVDVFSTAQYEIAEWASRRFGSQDRIFVGGDAGFAFNLFSNVLQVGSGHQPSTPNFIQAVGVYTIYSGTNAGDLDFYYSLLWLKAFGARAVIVPTPIEGSSIQPFSNPNKFQGKLTVIGEANGWRAYDTGYAQHSLFRVVNERALVVKRPSHGLDIGQLEPFVREIDANYQSFAKIQMLAPGHWAIDAKLDSSKVIAAALNYDTGWVAFVAGKRIETRRDGLGLLVLSPRCTSECHIDLKYDAGPLRHYSYIVGWSAWAILGLGVGRVYYRRLAMSRMRERSGEDLK